MEEAEPRRLMEISLRRIRLRFKEPVEIGPLFAVEGVSLVARESDTEVTIQVEGDLDRLIKALAAFPVSDLQTEHLSLEEVFLSYYQADKEEEN